MGIKSTLLVIAEPFPPDPACCLLLAPGWPRGLDELALVVTPDRIRWDGARPNQLLAIEYDAMTVVLGAAGPLPALPPDESVAARIQDCDLFAVTRGALPGCEPGTATQYRN